MGAFTYHAPCERASLSPSFPNALFFISPIMKLPQRLRVTYALTHPFSSTATLWLVSLYLAALAGLLVFNFVTQAKRLICVSSPQPNYDSQSCDQAPLGFFQTYYTRPQNEHSIGTIGTFPWQTNAFGNGTSDSIDYSILSLNWTADPLSCIMYEQSFVLHLDSQSSTVAACWYCGSELRILCTAVDSERTGIPASSRLAYRPILDQFDQLSLDIFAVGQVTGGNSQNDTVLAVRFDYHTTVPGLALGVTPFNDTSVSVALGTTDGYVPVRNTSSDPALASIASASVALGAYIQGVMSDDLQPSVPSGNNLRTLNVDYSCRTCEKQYKSALEIFAVLIGNTFGVLGTIFLILRTIAEFLTKTNTNSNAVAAENDPSVSHQQLSYQYTPPIQGLHRMQMQMPAPPGGYLTPSDKLSP